MGGSACSANGDEAFSPCIHLWHEPLMAHYRTFLHMPGGILISTMPIRPWQSATSRKSAVFAAPHAGGAHWGPEVGCSTTKISSHAALIQDLRLRGPVEASNPEQCQERPLQFCLGCVALPFLLGLLLSQVTWGKQDYVESAASSCPYLSAHTLSLPKSWPQPRNTPACHNPKGG